MQNGRNNVQAPPSENGELAEAQNGELKAARAQLKKACDELAEKKKQLSDKDDRLEPTMKDDFLQHAHYVVQLAFKKYNQLFHKAVGPGEVVPDLIRSKRAGSPVVCNESLSHGH